MRENQFEMIKLFCKSKHFFGEKIVKHVVMLTACFGLCLNIVS